MNGTGIITVKNMRTLLIVCG